MQCSTTEPQKHSFRELYNIQTQNMSFPKIHILQLLLCRLIIDKAKRILTRGNPSQHVTSTTVYRGYTKCFNVTSISIIRDLNTLHIDSGSLMHTNYMKIKCIRAVKLAEKNLNCLLKYYQNSNLNGINSVRKKISF